VQIFVESEQELPFEIAWASRGGAAERGGPNYPGHACWAKPGSRGLPSFFQHNRHETDIPGRPNDVCSSAQIRHWADGPTSLFL